MGRRPAKIKADATWETTDDPNAIMPWVRATEILLKVKARRDARLQKLEQEDPTAFFVEMLISFARKQEETLLYNDKGLAFYVEVPMDMVRKKESLLYTIETTGRTRKEPMDALAKVSERYLQTKSLAPADYSELTRNAPYTLALLGLYLVHLSSNPPPSE